MKLKDCQQKVHGMENGFKFIQEKENFTSNNHRRESCQGSTFKLIKMSFNGLYNVRVHTMRPV